MALDPSIYSNVGRVNLGQGLSDILNQQREREAAAEQRQFTLATLAQQKELGALNIGKLKREEAMYPQQMADAERKRSSELRAHLYGGVQRILMSGAPDSKIKAKAWGAAEAAKYNIPQESTNQALSALDTDQDPITIAQTYDQILRPDVYSKERAQSLYAKPKPSDIQLEPVIGPNGQPILVPREKAVGMQPYRAVASDDLARQRLDLARQEFEFKKTGGGPAIRKPMTADQEAKYRQKFGEAYGTTINALQSAENVTALANELKTHKGLSGITGYSGYAPDIPGRDAAAARQKFETLQGKITKMAKDAAASSGSIGPMAVQEWKILRDQITAIDPTKLSEKQMQNVMDDLIEQASKAAQITEEAYTSTFSPDFEAYPQFANPRGAMPKTVTPKAQTPTAGSYDTDKEARYQAWKAQQGR